MKNIIKIAVVFLLLFFIPFIFAYSHSPTGWQAPEEAKKVKNPVPAVAESLERGRKNYIARCQVCHGEKGDGKGVLAASLPVKPANFTDKKMMDSMTDGELFWKITNGKGPMPSWKDTLKENERWDIINFIRTFSSSQEKEKNKGQEHSK
ncbi:MAG: cytochrome c [Candidatus Schekmanbacteria bacterium]|nr:MAG: cytochrome c [Candidatus Schekmanbacteria bacterium]